MLTHELRDEDERKRLHGVIADHLEALPDGDALRGAETMVHIIGLADTGRAALYLARIQPRQWIDAAGRAELSGAVARVAEWLQAGTTEAASRRVGWTADLLRAPALSVEAASAVANAFVFDLDAVLSLTRTSVAESARGALLEEVRETLRQRLLNADLDGHLRLRIERDVSLSQERLGDFYQRRGGAGDGERALEHYEQSLTIAQRLYAQNPNDAQAARDVSVSHFKLARMYEQLSRSADANHEWRQCLVVLRQMRAAGMVFDPDLQRLFEQLEDAFA